MRAVFRATTCANATGPVLDDDVYTFRRIHRASILIRLTLNY